MKGLITSRNGAPGPGEGGKWRDGVPTGTGGSVLLGAGALAAFVLVFGIWAVTAELTGAAIAPGIVTASGQNQVIEHLEGGIVSGIPVAEGDHVEAGQIILTLDETKAVAERNRAEKALISAEASLLRALAERNGAEAVEFGDDLIERAQEHGMLGDLEQQREEFRSRLERLRSDLAVLGQRKEAYREEIAGLTVQKSSEQRKLEVIREELADKQGLLEKGLTSRSQVAALQRAEADSLGRIGGLTATIGQRKASITEIEEQMLSRSAERRETASTKINELRARMADLSERLSEYEDIVERSTIRAPVDGVVVKLAHNTVGGVVRPGENVAEILPTGEDLVVEARIDPRDIDAVKVGQRARLHLSALNARTTPEVAARVTYLSADRLQDEQSEESYYIARLTIADELPDAITPEQIFPGMPVDAFITTEARTFIGYLVRPMRDSFNKAFREE